MTGQTYFKVLTHDLRPPLQGGDPLPISDLPYATPAVTLDTRDQACAPGWHCADDLAAAFRIAGLWGNGRPARAFEVEPADDLIERGDKLRASHLTFTRELDFEDIECGVFDLSKPFGRLRREMTDEQMAWYAALGSPEFDPERVEAGLREALDARGLEWNLKRYQDARDAWTAWAARAARDAQDALSVFFASSNGWVDHSTSLLTTGLRDAYTAGLGIALPTGPNELGWVMDSEAER